MIVLFVQAALIAAVSGIVLCWVSSGRNLRPETERRMLRFVGILGLICSTASLALGVAGLLIAFAK